MDKRPIVTREQWLEQRKSLLAREKELTRLRDDVSRQRRELPWVRVDATYTFTGPAGKRSLAELFDGKSQLIVQHFMLGPDWKEGCVSCSFWADNFDGIAVHLAHRDVSFVAVSLAPLDVISRYRDRMGWNFPWYSSAGSTFNFDFGVSFTVEQIEAGAEYNYSNGSVRDELPGVSVFARDGDDVFHTYSTYARGLDMLNGAYHYLDLAPKGRDEANLAWPMAWLRRHDEYEA